MYLFVTSFWICRSLVVKWCGVTCLAVAVATVGRYWEMDLHTVGSGLLLVHRNQLKFTQTAFKCQNLECCTQQFCNVNVLRLHCLKMCTVIPVFQHLLRLYDSRLLTCLQVWTFATAINPFPLRHSQTPVGLHWFVLSTLTPLHTVPACLFLKAKIKQSPSSSL